MSVYSILKDRAFAYDDAAKARRSKYNCLYSQLVELVRNAKLPLKLQRIEDFVCKLFYYDGSRLLPVLTMSVYEPKGIRITSTVGTALLTSGHELGPCVLVLAETIEKYLKHKGAFLCEAFTE